MKFYLSLVLFVSFNICNSELNKEKALDSKYIVCIDGGGSKTSMKLINSNGQVVSLYKNNKVSDVLVSTCSNINFVGVEAFKKVLDDLFDNLYVDQTKIPFSEIASSCYLIAGFSGGSPVNLKKAQEKFQLKGFNLDQLFLTSDAELSLELIKPTGVVLIAGTGSIAFGIEDNKKFRTGGFGKLLNDSGNGYSMGISAIRAALEHDHDYGDFTVLTRRIKELYNIEKIYDLVVPIHSGEILQDKIALLSIEVFEHSKTDKVCERIVQETSEHLVTLIIGILKRMHAKEVTIALVGGLFNQGSLVDQIISNEKLKKWLQENEKSIIIKDKSKDNIACEVAKMILNK
ncbi:MAG: BadF/BadG/BcrA/BcrD ATPase family protein [Candidatus Babeliales bacterium]|nr:BadF/BadG/BcrA/BcrD ATPase family protein [Candidatus Babeliales bacterium]